MNDLLRPDTNIPQSIIQASPETYPLCSTEKEAELYLSLILHPKFFYTNEFSYDLIDYEKILYIEDKFQNSESIQNKITMIKKNIVKSYIYRQKYLYRISDCLTDINDENRELQQGYFELPEEMFKEQ